MLKQRLTQAQLARRNGYALTLILGSISVIAVGVSLLSYSKIGMLPISVGVLGMIAGAGIGLVNILSS